MSAFIGNIHQSLILTSHERISIIFHRGSLVNSHLALQTLAQRRRKSVLSEEKETVLIETESGSDKLIFDIRILTIDNLSGGMRAALKEMVNVKLLFDPIFFLIGISNAIGMIGFYTPFVYLPSMAAQYVILHNSLKKIIINIPSFRMGSAQRMPPSWCL